ncbi:MAG: hypothetical protein QOH36_1083 [Actinomycetota bacterium]|nr:hypothetical protein [Actinomycetota bacterium]
MRRTRKFAVVLAVAALGFTACGKDSKDSSASAQKDIEARISSLAKAEQDKDATTFLAGVTDTGLEAFDEGTREEIKSGGGSFGQDPPGDPVFVSTKVDGSKATTVADFPVGVSIFRVSFDLVDQDGKWLVDGVDFIGGPPPSPGQSVLDITAADYAFTIADPSRATGDFAIKFSNTGTEAHEMTLFELPAGKTAADAKVDLADVAGDTLENVPAPYKLVDHLTFGLPGESSDFRFAEQQAPGRYVIACFIPQGVKSEADFATAQGPPHIQLGMVAELTIA